MREAILAAYERRAVCLLRTWASTQDRQEAVNEDHKTCFNIARTDFLIDRLNKAGITRKARKHVIREATLGSECVQSY